MVMKNGTDYKLREIFEEAKVALIIDGVTKSKHGEYRAAVDVLQRTYGLNDAEIMQVYRDYKDDYDMQ